jgi:predicted GH43/DUF377 family glycosyl hydrolase
VERLDVRLNADPGRVLLRSYPTSGPTHARNLIARTLALAEPEVEALWRDIELEFGGRHRDYGGHALARFEEIRPLLPGDAELSEPRRLVLGASFLMEYSLECAALFNPSIVAHPDQSAAAPGSLRFLLSLRATGEGHVSSITFRQGCIDAAGEVSLEAGSRFVTGPRLGGEQRYDSGRFRRMLLDLGLSSAFARKAFESLAEQFTLAELRESLTRLRDARRDLDPEAGQDQAIADRILSLALSNSEVVFPPDLAISEQALFPFTPSQSNGIEDARFVRFEDGTYYGTYTAYDGHHIMPQMIATRDFRSYRFMILSGAAVQNKGMALFPRKVNGLYTMLGRQDAENVFLSQSEDIHFWPESRLIVKPRFPWEMVQIGNCGSPIETDAGWLVLTHGVGPTRKYSIGVLLLDKDDPSRVIGRLPEPIISPNSEEREGYVPNVVYTCGGIVHGENLIVPYAMSDSASRFVRIRLADLLSAMR